MAEQYWDDFGDTPDELVHTVGKPISIPHNLKGRVYQLMPGFHHPLTRVLKALNLMPRR